MNDPTPSYSDAGALQVLKEIQIKALNLVRSTDDLDQLSKAVEIAKNSADARKGFLGRDGVQFWATTLTPLATVLIAIVGLIVQARQYTKSANIQAQQRVESADRQRTADEDTQWREAMNALAYDDSSHSLASAMRMQSFFKYPRFEALSRTVAASALPQISNVGGFDTVWFAMVAQTNAKNQRDVIGIAQKVAAIQWHRWDASPLTFRRKYQDGFPFVETRVNSIDFVDPSAVHKKSEPDFGVAAWELDSISRGLADLWAGKTGDKTDPAKPTAEDLSNLVLENKDFSGLDFRDTNLQHSVLSHVTFRRAKLTNVNFDGTFILDDVDLCEVTEFSNSSWKNTRWWRATCLSPELREFLLKYFPQQSPEGGEKANKLSVNPGRPKQ